MSVPPKPLIDSHEDGDITVLTLCHGKASAFDLELSLALEAAVDAFEDSAQRALLITGSGSIFSAGVDLFRVLKDGIDYVHTFMPAFTRAFQRLTFVEKPVVCAINGHAIAGGAILACCGDRRIAAAGKGRMGVPELIVGVPFPPLVLEILRMALAPQHLQRVLYAGETLGMEEAQRIAFVEEVVPAEDLLERALAVARQMAQLPPRSFALAKEQVRQPLKDAMEKHGAAWEKINLEQWALPETFDRIRQYLAQTVGKR